MFTLSSLPYPKNALEPYISEKLVTYHYEKHHRNYVNNLNKLISGTEYEGKLLEDIIKTSSGNIFNNASQVWNHTFYWNCLTPRHVKENTCQFFQVIERKFGNFKVFKERFIETATTIFGSGWAWLVKNKTNEIEIRSTSNAGCPIKDGEIPLLVCDIWEHAYYIDYYNQRPIYINAFWKLIDWEFVNNQWQSSL